MIDADSADVAATLQEIARIVVSEGGYVSPGTVFTERAGLMNVEHAPTSADGDEILIRVPRHLLVPVTGTTWATAARVLAVDAYGADLTAVQRTLLDLIVRLYNATGKVDWYRTCHPKGALAAADPIVAAVQRVRPRFAIEPGAAGLLRTRQFLLPGPGADPDARPRPGRQVLMPLIDLLNHHPEARPFGLTDDRLAVVVSQPDATRECFVRYGQHRDTLDLALSYGFVADGVPFAFSAPLAVEVDGLGELVIDVSRPGRRDPRTFPAVVTTDAGLRFSHLVVDERHPQRARTAVSLPVRALVARRGRADADAVAARAVAAVVEANLSLLDAVVEATEREPSPAAAVIAGAARRQGAVLATLREPAA